MKLQGLSERESEVLESIDQLEGAIKSHEADLEESTAPSIETLVRFDTVRFKFEDILYQGRYIAA
jgi:hypothetical protein